MPRGNSRKMVRGITREKTAAHHQLPKYDAEGVKIGLIVLLLWLVMATYRGVVVPVFIGSFIFTALFFAMAFFVRDNE